MRGERAARLSFKWWRETARTVLSYEHAFRDKARALFHLKPDEFLSFNKEFGSDFEIAVRGALGSLGLAMRLTRDQHRRGLSGNRYEFDLTGESNGQNGCPAGRYFVECKFSNPFDYSTFRECFERQVLGLPEVVCFANKCADVVNEEKSQTGKISGKARAKSQPTFPVLVTNRRVEESALRWAHSYGVLILSPEEPPAPALAVISRRGSKNNTQADLLERLIQVEIFLPVRPGQPAKLSCESERLFTDYYKLLDENRQHLMKLTIDGGLEKKSLPKLSI